MSKTIAVTGSSGFIGSRLVKKLLSEKHHLTELDLSNGIDLLDPSVTEKVPSFDVIFHLAARSYVPDSFKDPGSFYHNNIISTLNVLEMARKYQAKVVYFSSYVYGNPHYLPIDEKHPLEAHNPYAQSKIICEKLCESYAKDIHIPVIICRPFNIYGKGQDSRFLIPGIIRQMESGVVKLQDSRPKRDFIYINDIIEACMRLLDFDPASLEIFNLGFGKSYSIMEVVDMIKEITKKEFIVEFSNEIRPQEVFDTVSDNSKCMSLLNWKPETDLFAGLRQMLV